MPEVSEKLVLNTTVTGAQKSKQDLETISGGVTDLSKNVDNFIKGAGFLIISEQAKAAFNGIKNEANAAIDAFSKQQSALIGFGAVAKAKGIDVSNDFVTSLDLVKSGLLSVGDASSSLKNLIASNFSLQESVDLLNAFGDSAAFNRQGALAFGESIVGATEGIKNQNSILVDNAGITKNLSIILKEAGYSVQDVGKVTTEAGVRQALFNGLLKEGALFAGNAKLSLDSLQGSTTQLDTATNLLQSSIGSALAPAWSEMQKTITPLIQSFTEFTSQHPVLVKNILLVTGAITGLTVVFTTLAVAAAALTIAFGAVTVPILLISAAIAGLIAIGILLVANWEDIKQKSIEIWDSISIFVSNSITGIKTNATLLMSSLKLIFSFWMDVINKEWQKSWNDFKGIVTNVWEAIKNTIDTISQNITTVINNVITSITNAINAAKNLIGIGGSSVSTTISGKRALGGPVNSGGTYLVGENGPELFTPTIAGNITPNNKMGGLTINFSGVFGKDAAEEIGNMITQKLSRSFAY